MFTISIYTGYQECTVEDHCAGECMRAYFTRYGVRCAKALNKDTIDLTCGDYMRLHDGGPDGCGKSETQSAATKINVCMLMS